ncbi:hypothetical protein [uncultured Desulfobulbus sp.]|uniref:hypothetical protein n=1 Tax=uncultured Desulfobulbus sp. TaxID=239745 RepID=UPI0029C8EFED|nr:hypothetical protein [uncultured Desulfobulbus sp.]
MIFMGRFLLSVVLFALMAASAHAASPFSCESMQKHMEGLKAAIKKAPNKEAAARERAKLDRVSEQYTEHCMKPKTGKPGTAAEAWKALLQATMQQLGTPEEESQRRRDAINQKGRQLGDKSTASRTEAGGKEVPVPHAIPVEGVLLIEGGSSSTFYGKVKQELSYTIQETFVGNLIVTRYYDHAAGRYSAREDYAIQTLSAEIFAGPFSGRGCAKYTGSPPVCTQWHQIDLWQIADGEEYPGRFDGVVSATSDGRAVTIRIDGPDIEFGSSQGPVTIKTGCGDLLRETVKRDEFKQWMRRSIVRIKRDVSKTSPGCRPGSTVSLEMHIGSGQ